MLVSTLICFLRRGWLALALLLLLAAPARATHIVGGEMDLQYLTGNTYQLTLTLYFDAVNGQPGALDSDLTASIFEKGSNRRMADVLLPLVNNALVQYTNPACSTPSLITRKLSYTRQLTLSAQEYANSSGYYVAVERCCRNNGINNIVNPGGAAQTFYLEFRPWCGTAWPCATPLPASFRP
ncbi:hypothetical protein [Hymenobacter rubripertinctus]|uniref:Uncharacterized protein n=1 Tax=Hymenobacter rubripertinctus TaxID=2029981 RepID=A0A418QM33_9BACT|nr:hypothetical protein [Hymenobacter rubripertinctus]RIY06214.1 hypothetical protein D0T11_18980 [Hymenobacter rubripertinctus]